MDDFAQGKNVTALPHGLQFFTWETKIQDLLPGEWGLSDHWAMEKADLRDVLSHVSGLPRHVRVSGSSAQRQVDIVSHHATIRQDMSYRTTDSTLDVIKRMPLLKPTRELRQKFQYNNQVSHSIP